MEQMLSKLQTFSRSRINLIVNFFYIGLMKFLNIGSKYILVGYLIRVLGENGYGLLTWIDSIVQYFIMITNFGFDLYAAKHVVENKDNPEKLNKVISTIYYIKGLLFCICILMLIPLSFNSEINTYISLIALMMLMGIGEVCAPLWFFQGIEKMKTITLITFFTKLFLIVFTFLFVKNSSHLLLYITLLVVTNTVWGVWSFIMMKKVAEFRFVKVLKSDIISYLQEGYLFFVGKFSTFLFNIGALFLIGYLFSIGQVAGFDIAIKIIFVFIIPFEVLQQALFPAIVRGVTKKTLQQIIIATLLISSFISALLFVFSERIIVIFGGLAMLKYTYVLNLVLVLIPVVSLTIIVGNCIMVARGFYKQYNASLLFAGLFFIAVLLTLKAFDQLTFLNLIIARIGTELALLLMRIYYVLKNKLILN